MVKERLLQSDAQESGWLLDGYPRSASQANAIKDFGFRPDLFILLEVIICLTADAIFKLTKLPCSKEDKKMG